MKIYHGSCNIIEKPIYGKGKPYNDYGLGFYCTEDVELAKEWSINEEKYGYVNIYDLDISDLKIFDFKKLADPTLYWLTLLLKNRTFELKNDIAKDGKNYLLTNYDLDLSEYDIIIGYRADDSFFTYANNFLNNIISKQKLEKALKLGDLGEQVVLISKKAFTCIHYLGNIQVPHEEYYNKRIDRILKARLKYEKIRESKDDSDYLIDIIRKGK